MTTVQPIVDLQGVTKRFGTFTAVNHVSLRVQPGEFLTLLGPSGCGKTTLLRLIAGFELPDEGEIALEGRRVTELPPYRRNVNQVFQSYALFPHLSVRDNIAFGLRMQKLARQDVDRRVAEVVALVALTGFEDRRPDQLSGGQRQRVALARALAPRPAVLLLDEPLSALDAKLRQSMQFELKRLQRQLGLTFIFVTHDQEEALAMSDRIAVMKEGRVEQVGTADEIYHRPTTAFVAEFVGETNLLSAALMKAAPAYTAVRVADLFDLTLPSNAWPGAIRQARLSLRPEKLHVAPKPLTGSGTFSVTVAEKNFLGATSQLVLLSDNGLRLKATVINESSLQISVRVGDRVFCGVHADDVSVLP